MRATTQLVAPVPDASELDWVARRDITWVDPDGTWRLGAIAVARPHELPSGEWGCRVIAGGWSTRVFTIFGVDSWQALMLALQFAGYEAHRFAHHGGRALWPNGEDGAKAAELDFDSLLGPLFRAPPPIPE